MNKTELIAAAAEASGMTKKDAERCLNAAIDLITESLVKGQKVQLPASAPSRPRTGMPALAAIPIPTRL